MREYKDFESFSKMGDVAQMYIDKAFEDLNVALENEYKLILIDKSSLNYSDIDQEVYEQYLEAIKDPISFLRSPKPSVTEFTYKIYAQLRAESTIISRKSSFKFAKNHLIKDYFILSHVTNLALFIEILINRHLYFLAKDKVIDKFAYNQLEKASVLNKILFVFKYDDLPLNRISRHFTLRNFAVHFTADNANNFNVSIEELIGIWGDIGQLILRLHRVEKFYEDFVDVLDSHIEEFYERWG